MRVNRIAIGAGALAAALILAGLWYVGRGDPSAPARQRPAAPSPAGTAVPAPTLAAAPRPSGTPLLPAVTVEEGRIRGADPSGRVQWELRALTLQVDADRDEVRLTGVEGTFLEQGKPAVTFTAPLARFDMQTRNITLSGGVRARAGSGRSVDAQEIRYLASRRLLVATGGVRLTQERMVVRADRLESDVALRRTRLTGHITVTIRE